jgi:hypothetical protein
MQNPYTVSLIAFSIVMTGMVSLTGVFYLLRYFGRRKTAATALAPSAELSNEADEELLAVLAAAAREALQAPVKVYHVHVHREATVERWSRAGRMDVMISHRVERKR